MTALLDVRDLAVDYGGNRAVHPTSFQLQAGTLACIAGANGAGKSSIVNALLGWSRGHPRLSGKVFLGGAEMSSLTTTQRARQGLQLVPEGMGLYSDLTVEENLAGVRPPDRGTGRQGYSNDEIFVLFPRLSERLDHLGSALSGGERGMVAVARALKAGPRVLILDEPSIGLAPQLISVMLAAIRNLVDQGLTVLLVEQNVQAALDVSDHVFLLERGSVIAQGPAEDMRHNPRLIDAYLGADHG